MEVLLKNVTIVDPESPQNGNSCDVLLADGIIREVGTNLSTNGQVVEQAGLHLSPGWFDMRANFCDPGFEHREDLQSGPKAAAAGGFTGVAVMPTTVPPIDTKSGVEYVQTKTASSAVDVHPVGSVSERLEGNDLAEIFDMKQAGAVAFSDNKQSIHSAELLKRALLYARPIDALVMSFPNDASIAGKGQIHEGPTSTALGLRGIPSLAEELMVARDLSLLAYTEGRLHLGPISTAQSVNLIREAKANGLNVTAEVAIHNLVLTDTELQAFDTNLKVLPPLRAATDVAALIEGLKDGTIDVISSDHTPVEPDLKKREFDHASFGMVGLETTFALAHTHLVNELGLPGLVDKLAISPRKVLGLPVPCIEAGAQANLTLFDPTAQWVFKSEASASKSSNTPFADATLIGRPFGIYNRGILHLN